MVLSQRVISTMMPCLLDLHLFQAHFKIGKYLKTHKDSIFHAYLSIGFLLSASHLCADAIEENTVGGTNCSASIDYVKCLDPNWISCNSNEATGTCVNHRTGEKCKMQLGGDDIYDYSGIISCPSCHIDTAEGCDGTEVSDIAACWRYDTDPDSGSISTVIVENAPCIEAIRDGTCSIPHFKYEELVWDVCVDGNGTGTCTNILLDIPCDVYTSSICVTGATSCGIIYCVWAGVPRECHASWNMPDKPKFYESPYGCMSGKSPNPSADSNNKNNLVLPLSLVGTAVFTGIVSVVTTAAICLCYSRYRRQGYQAVN